MDLFFSGNPNKQLIMIYFVEAETETVEVLLVIPEVIQVTSKNNALLKKSKIFPLKLFYPKPSQ